MLDFTKWTVFSSDLKPSVKKYWLPHSTVDFKCVADTWSFRGIEYNLYTSEGRRKTDDDIRAEIAVPAPGLYYCPPRDLEAPSEYAVAPSFQYHMPDTVPLDSLEM
jgi:hypothetical protein